MRPPAPVLVLASSFCLCVSLAWSSQVGSRFVFHARVVEGAWEKAKDRVLRVVAQCPAVLLQRLFGLVFA